MNDAVDKVLSEPLMPELSDTERRVKNNLIAFSVVAIFMCSWGLSISDDSSILGLKFNGLDQHKIYIALGLFIVYSGIHYSWHVHDIFVEWRLRWTAISELRTPRFSGTFFNSDLKNKRNNTLYHWWNDTKRYVTDRDKINDALINTIEALEVQINNNEFNSLINAQLKGELSKLTGLIKPSHDDIKELIRVLNLPPFTEALPKFNDAFRYFLKSQNIRWIIFDFLVPFGFAIAAIILIYSKVVII